VNALAEYVFNKKRKRKRKRNRKRKEKKRKLTELIRNSVLERLDLYDTKLDPNICEKMASIIEKGPTPLLFLKLERTALDRTPPYRSSKE
jgi:hypothetical protein